ncbi:transcription factor S [Candidatus Pacearchaeota archaeon]|nr:transcription factor S [Candidatus Pacearchaeota archaeon]
MEFCPKCGTILVKKTKNYGCPRCNYSLKGKIKMETSEKIEKKGKVDVVKENVDILPITKFKCKKCGNEEAHFWTVQTRAGDEAETQFFRCTKCKFTHREYR